MSHKRSPVHDLPTFHSAKGLPQSSPETIAALNSDCVRQVHSHALGPQGTNIIKAAMHWHESMGIAHKARIIECKTPEDGLQLARSAKDDGTLHVFWTCGVYFKEHELFFTNPDTLPFQFQVIMPLDEMQLASRADSVSQLLGADSIAHCSILTHPSPAPLLNTLPVKVIHVSSNAEAAIRCAAGEAEGCITTEAARVLHGLVTVHRFGSPPMIFFGGVSTAGADLLRRSLATLRVPNELSIVATAATTDGRRLSATRVLKETLK